MFSTCLICVSSRTSWLLLRPVTASTISLAEVSGSETEAERNLADSDEINDDGRRDRHMTEAPEKKFVC